MRPALSRAAVTALAAAAVAVGCGTSAASAPQRFPSTGPARTIRVALTAFRWPLDPALAATRDETTLVRTLHETPLETDTSGRVVPGLCSGWRALDGFRTWRFRCRHAAQIAGELRRVARMRASPANWIFAAARRISATGPDELVVRLDLAWRRFPYAMTVAAAAPQGVAGPYELVRGSANRVVVRRPGQTVVFRRLGPGAILPALRQGRLDEAPVPLGDLAEFRTDPSTLHVRLLLALDAVTFRGRRVPATLRRAYWETANRSDYEALVPEGSAPAAQGLVGGSGKADPSAFRRTVRSIASLPPVEVRLALPVDPTLQYGTRLLYAQWRELGLGVRLVASGARPDADLERIRATYPQDEALLGALRFAAALGQEDQRAAFDRVDARLRQSALVIPVCWVADARWVSPRVHGWNQDVLGDVDYGAVSLG